MRGGEEEVVEGKLETKANRGQGNDVQYAGQSEA